MIGFSLQETLKLKIAEIITLELTEQRATAEGEYKDFLDTLWNSENQFNIFIDRFTPLDASELNAIVITPEKVVYENGSTRTSQNTAFYYIDVVGDSATTDNEIGDVKCNRTIQRINGVIIAILNKAKYARLDLAPGTISSKKWIETIFYRPNPDTSAYPNAVTSRLEIEYDENKIMEVPVNLLKNSTDISGRFSILTEL